jgi:hypothetical protein
VEASTVDLRRSTYPRRSPTAAGRRRLAAFDLATEVPDDGEDLRSYRVVADDARTTAAAGFLLAAVGRWGVQTMATGSERRR